MKNFHFDFQTFINEVTNGKTVLEMPDEKVEEIYQIGVYCGMFSTMNYGFEERKNAVSNFVTMLQHMIGKESNISVPEPTINLEQRVAKLEEQMQFLKTNKMYL